MLLLYEIFRKRKFFCFAATDCGTSDCVKKDFGVWGPEGYKNSTKVNIIVFFSLKYLKQLFENNRSILSLVRNYQEPNSLTTMRDAHEATVISCYWKINFIYTVFRIARSVEYLVTDQKCSIYFFFGISKNITTLV